MENSVLSFIYLFLVQSENGYVFKIGTPYLGKTPIVKENERVFYCVLLRFLI